MVRILLVGHAAREHALAKAILESNGSPVLFSFMKSKPKKILITGQSFSGKTYVSRCLKKQGINAIDADLIKDLGRWEDQKGKFVGP